MKQLCLISLLSICISFNLNSQSDLVGNWYLDHLVINNFTYQNVYGNLQLNLTENPSYLGFQFDGEAGCNAIFGDYTYTQTEIELYAGQTLVDCGQEPRGQYEYLFLSVLDNISAPNNSFTYVIEGVGETQTLTLTNAIGDQLVYSKVENLAVLTRTWYLETIVDNNITYNINSPDSPTLFLSTDDDNFFGNIALNGQGDCNTFSGDYHIYFGMGDEIDLSNFSPTTNTCDPSSDFEAIYFSILNDEDANKFNFEIINDGNTLVLNSIPASSGGRLSASSVTSLSFSKQSLSVGDFSPANFSISLKQNPVSEQLELIYNDLSVTQNIEYTIFAIDGKRISSGVFDDGQINVTQLNTGMYFLNLESNNKPLTTLKFIKK
ncbi:META domain-containing protein [Winogradskyella tangerina]|uniref:META domain-containing protein n=1 Tax=Winogradskyella tangerina TaxID=2023240 RepID=UPI000DBE330E|nr:META domain-containing protein [Winogradskyella tangerina]